MYVCMYVCIYIYIYIYIYGDRGGTWLRCCATTGRSLVRFQMASLEFFIDIILPFALWPWVESASNRNEYQEYFMGVKAAGA